MNEEEPSESSESTDNGEKPVPPEFSEAALTAAENINQLTSMSDQLAAQLQQQLQSIEGSMSQIRRGLDQHLKSLDRIEEIYADSFSQVIEQAALQRSEIQSAFESLNNLPMENFARRLKTSEAQFAQALSSLSIDVARAFEGVDVSALEEALQRELEQRREDLEESTAEQSVSEFIVEVYFGVYRRLPSNTISRETILTIILTVFLTVYQVESSSQDAHQITGELQEIQRVIKEEHSILSEDDSGEQELFVVTTELNLRAKPSTEATSEMTIGYNQEVELVKRREEWAYVMFYDDVKEMPRSGWVHTEYIESVD